VRRFCKHGLPIFLDEGLHDQIIGIALSDALVDLLQHPESGIAGTGERASDVVATAGRIVATAAHAFHLHAQLVRMIERLCVPKSG
jgi:hypothetical protein